MEENLANIITIGVIANPQGCGDSSPIRACDFKWGTFLSTLSARPSDHKLKLELSFQLSKS